MRAFITKFKCAKASKQKNVQFMVYKFREHKSYAISQKKRNAKSSNGDFGLQITKKLNRPEKMNTFFEL